MKPQTELTSTETASLLDVHPSTVKRWCNDGELESDQTPGGHRRIRIDKAVDFARRRGIRTVLTPFHPFEPHVWTALRAATEDGSFEPLHGLALQWARRGEFERLEQLYLALGREESLSFVEFCDRAVRGLMTSVGDEWQDGKLRVGDEHMVSQAMTAALITLRREWIDGRDGALGAGNGTNGSHAGSSGDDAGTMGDGEGAHGNGSGRLVRGRPRAVVGTMEDNQHQMGSLCVRLLLERKGWEVFYPGADVPVEDFGAIQRSREASLVCISLPMAGTIGDVSRTLSILSGLYDRARPYSVVFGGGGSLELEGKVTEGPFESVGFLRECGSLSEAVDDGLGRPGGSR